MTKCISNMIVLRCDTDCKGMPWSAQPVWAVVAQSLPSSSQVCLPKIWTGGCWPLRSAMEKVERQKLGYTVPCFSINRAFLWYSRENKCVRQMNLKELCPSRRVGKWSGAFEKKACQGRHQWDPNISTLQPPS